MTPLEAGGYPIYPDESDYRTPPEGALPMTPQERIAKIESLMNEVAAEMREIPGALASDVIVDSSGGTAIRMMFHPALRIMDTLPDATTEEHPHGIRHQKVVGGVECYGWVHTPAAEGVPTNV